MSGIGYFGNGAGEMLSFVTYTGADVDVKSVNRRRIWVLNDCHRQCVPQETDGTFEAQRCNRCTSDLQENAMNYSSMNSIKLRETDAPSSLDDR